MRNPPTRPRITAYAALLYIVDDEGILFIQTSQQLYRLNTTATYIWCCYEAGMEPPAIADALAERFGVVKELALQDTVHTLSEWKAKGLLDPPVELTLHPVGDQQGLSDCVSSAVTTVSSKLFSKHYYRLLDLELQIGYPGEETASLVHPIFAHLETRSGGIGSGMPVFIEIEEHSVDYAVLMNGKLVGECLVRAELAPAIQREALLAAYEVTPCLLAIHAAAVCNDRQCVLMPAAKGSGKSTLMAALLASGYTYLTDELSLLTRDSHRIRPAPVSLGLKRGSWPVLTPVYPILESLPTHIQSEDVDVKYLTPPAELIASQKAYPVSHVVFPRYDAAMPTVLMPLNHAEAIWRIAEGGYAVPGQLDKDGVERLIDWITPLPCYELSVGKLDDAVRALEALLG